jgi:hypothetical protein
VFRLYIHPTVPPEPVIRANCSENFSRGIIGLLSIASWGWHIETAIYVLRIVLSGAFDKHPRLQLVMRHLGEDLSSMLPRVECVFPIQLTGNSRAQASTFREEMDCGSHKDVKGDIVHVESFADKSFAEGEGVRNTPTVKRVNDWFGASPRLSQALRVEACSDCAQTQMCERGALTPRRGGSEDGGDPETQG